MQCSTYLANRLDVRVEQVDGFGVETPVLNWVAEDITGTNDVGDDVLAALDLRHVVSTG